MRRNCQPERQDQDITPEQHSDRLRPSGRMHCSSSVPLHARPAEETITPEAFVDAEKVAAFLDIRRRRVLELARQGALPAHPLGKGKRQMWRFRLSELAECVGSRLNCSDAAARANRKENN